VSIQRSNPRDLPEYPGLTQIVKTTGGSTLHLSGQGAYDVNHRLVGGSDYYAQAKQAFLNVVTALASEGATFADVVKATYYVVRITPEALDGFVRAMNEVLGDAAGQPPASTMVGVDSLAYGEMLVEIDVTAVVR
jgi:enamine deaminase RidA (YjgF/YER057c/UK114 family)